MAVPVLVPGAVPGVVLWGLGRLGCPDVPCERPGAFANLAPAWLSSLVSGRIPDPGSILRIVPIPAPGSVTALPADRKKYFSSDVLQFGGWFSLI